MSRKTERTQRRHYIGLSDRIINETTLQIRALVAERTNRLDNNTDRVLVVRIRATVGEELDHWV